MDDDPGYLPVHELELIRITDSVVCGKKPVDQHDRDSEQYDDLRIPQVQRCLSYIQAFTAVRALTPRAEREIATAPSIAPTYAFRRFTRLGYASDLVGATGLEPMTCCL